MNVHQAVHAAQEKETGITIHYVNEHYDEGNIIFQASCALTPEDTPEDIALKIRGLEHGNYPRIIDELLEKL
jgi:phosphoribosylglycinamide formyltransferase-1